MGTSLECINVKTGSYWYISRTNESGRFYPCKVTLDGGVNTTIWTRNFKHAITFPSEFAAHSFTNSRKWHNDEIEIFHIHRGAVRSMVKVK